MTIPGKPKLDSWYEDEEGRRFRIVAIDDRDGAIEIQYFDGDVAEVEGDTWYLLDLKSIADPGYGSGPFDDLEQDNLVDPSQAERPEEWDSEGDEMDYDD